MSKSKSYKFSIELRDISGISPGPSQCKIDVSGRSGLIDAKNPMFCILEDVTPVTVITITLSRASVTIGVCRVSFNAMFGEGLQGKAEKWVRLKETQPSGKDLKVKLAASLAVISAKDSFANPATNSIDSVGKDSDVKTIEFSLNKERTLDPPKCPFVNSLAAQEGENEKLNEI